MNKVPFYYAVVILYETGKFPVVEVNIQEQESKHNSLKQGEKEFASSFKLRFDNQLKANNRTGVVRLLEAVREID